MKIVLTVTNDLHQDQRMDRICTTLAGAGHDVTLVGRLRPSSTDLPAKRYAQHRIPCRYEYGKAFYVEYNWRLWRTLREWDIDVLCSVDLDTLTAGVLLKRAHGCRLVFDAHEWFSETPEVVHRPAIRAFWRRLGKTLVPRADLCYTVAPQLAGRLAEEYGVPFGVVRSLPSATPLAPASEPEKWPDTGRKIIFYQGMLNPGRGLETAIRSLQHLPECELWLAGDGPELGALRRCREDGKEAKVKFLGFVPPADLPNLTRRAWLGLNLLKATAPSYYYSLANKALDYLRAGIPSVQMDFPEYAAINAEFGCYVLLPELDELNLAQQIRKLLEEENRYEDLRAGAVRAGRALTWEREAPVLLKLWEHVLKQG